MEDSDTSRHGGITGTVSATQHEGPPVPIHNAEILVYQLTDELIESVKPKAQRSEEQRQEIRKLVRPERSRRDGTFEIRGLDPGKYSISSKAFGVQGKETYATVTAGCTCQVPLEVDLGLNVHMQRHTEADTYEPCTLPVVGTSVILSLRSKAHRGAIGSVRWIASHGGKLTVVDPAGMDIAYTPTAAGLVEVTATIIESREAEAEAAARELAARDLTFRDAALPGTGGGSGGPAELKLLKQFATADAPIRMIGGKLGVSLARTAANPTSDQALWSLIRNRTRAISFTPYSEFIRRVLCQESERPRDAKLQREINELGNAVHGVGAYQLLKTATEVFLLMECGVCLHDLRFDQGRPFDEDEESARWGEAVTFETVREKLFEYLGGNAHQLPYITNVIRNAFPGLHQGRIFCDRVLTSRAKEPCLLELIWSYWHEEGMLVQTANAISRRFQNVRSSGDRDPLAHLETDPLRPVNNLLWGMIQDEQNRLTVVRRAYEYDHHYGLTLYGKVVPSFRPADSRSKFLEGFHNLLHLCSIFFKEDNDTTVIADGYPLLNSLKEVHLLLAQGAHNQFGDLPWTARVEMMVQEYLLSRSELREFLQSRAMVPYKEPWMPQVDTMKTMQGWSDITVTHFRDLGVYGEQVLLSVRYGDWIEVNDEDSAKNWARYWRPEIQAYLHAYRAATGIDLTNPDTVDATMPAVLLQKRLAIQQRAR